MWRGVRLGCRDRVGQPLRGWGVQGCWNLARSVLRLSLSCCVGCYRAELAAFCRSLTCLHPICCPVSLTPLSRPPACR